MKKTKEYFCPTCQKLLVKESIHGKRNIYKCGEHGLFRIKTSKRNIWKPKDKSEWHATCIECGNRKMEYYNFRYCCNKCGHILEV